MTRTAKHKLQYFVATLGYFSVAGLLIWWIEPTPVALIGIGLVLLGRGRISGILYRDLFTSRRLLESGDFENSIVASERFIERANAKPRLRKVGLWKGGIYTRDAIAMATNNIGAAYLELGELELAERALHEALEMDPEYPLPHWNLAMVAHLLCYDMKTEEHLRIGRDLGFANATSDHLIRRAASVLARIEGRREASE